MTKTLTYHGAEYPHDGTTKRYTSSHNCVRCHLNRKREPTGAGRPTTAPAMDNKLMASMLKRVW